jgi:gliding motility-associated lipoprotein GldB
MVKKFLLLFLVALCFAACNDENKVEEEISKIPVDLKVDRFDQVFAKASPSDLPQLKKEFPLLFPERFPDSVWVSMMNDTLQQEINREVTNTFPKFKQQEETEHFFQHLKYYFPQIEVPRIITVTSEVDYHNKVILADSVMLVSLDTYLGKEHKFYVGLQNYLTKNFNKGQIVPDMATAYAKQFTPENKTRTFLASMIYYGKLLYVKDKLIPEFTDAQKIGYTEDEIKWARANEEQIWRYFIEDEMLYNTDSELERRFINLAPFSKFRLELDRESPPQLGQYMGWQIVKQFAEKNGEVTLQELLQMEADQIFKESNYKPRKPE